MHPVAGAAAVEIDLVVARSPRRCARLRRAARDRCRRAAAPPGCSSGSKRSSFSRSPRRMAAAVIISVYRRVSGREAAQEIAAVAVGPIHHRRHGNPAIQLHTAIVADFFGRFFIEITLSFPVIRSPAGTATWDLRHEAAVRNEAAPCSARAFAVATCIGRPCALRGGSRMSRRHIVRPSTRRPGSSNSSSKLARVTFGATSKIAPVPRGRSCTAFPKLAADDL